MKGYTDRDLAQIVAEGRMYVRVAGTAGTNVRLTPGEVEYLRWLSEKAAGEDVTPATPPRRRE